MKLVAVVLAAFIAAASSLSAVEEFASGNLKFTARLYEEVLKEKPNENFVFSPLSVEIVLALTRAGAKGRTEQELTAGLNLPNALRTEDAFRQLLPALKKNTEDLKLLSANKLFLGSGFKTLEGFNRIATSLYDAGTENVDFSKSKEATDVINHWVEQRTNNKIQNLIKPDSLDALTRLVLVNALYFSGKWENPFEKGLTYPDKFYTSKSSFKKIDMMHVEDTFKYYECTKRNAKFIELPYMAAENLSMTIVLPNEVEGLSQLESNIEGLLTPPPLEWQRVALTMPKWTVDSNVPLKKILQKLGINDLFADTADLSGISNEGLKVDDVIQKAFINVTESGTEAAAATAVKFILTSSLFEPKKPLVVMADHPFFYLIKWNGIVLFTGKVYNP